MLQKEIENKLANYIDPYLKQDFFSSKSIKQLLVTEEEVKIDIRLGYPCKLLINNIIYSVETLLSPLLNEKNRKLVISVSQQIEGHTGYSGIAALPHIKNIIAVGSGKGGVGKSTIAVNLALALAKEARVGLLDADIYGPSQPAMLGTSQQKPVIEGKILSPVIKYGLQSMSIGYLIDARAPMVWRGPMLGKALQQLLQDTKWDELDYLIIDLPPGTGDIQLTLCQKLPLSGVVIVTTPQDLALLDVRRACEMFNKLNVPLLGVVENMSHYHCSQCGHEENIFGEGGAEKLVNEYKISLLAKVPLDLKIRSLTDNGMPPVIANPDGVYAKMFADIARQVGAQLALQPKDYSSKFPKIVVSRL